MNDAATRRPSRQGSFNLHAILAVAALLLLNVLISMKVPVVVEDIEYSYWIFFYHLPAALNCYIFFAVVLVTSIAYLRTEDPRWDQHARVAGEIGVLACSITLATGS
ncbi:MAG: cytochrome c biogenesis protein, partial [Planctomycetes bacterium]|nr:cytochrome c biogenesis protein [Planctomycetota bacterium]